MGGSIISYPRPGQGVPEASLPAVAEGNGIIPERGNLKGCARAVVTGGARTGFEPGRKLIHLLSGLIPLFYLWFDPSRREAVTILGILAIPFLGADIARRYLPTLNRAFSAWLEWALRENERERLTGASYSLIGAWLTLLLFEKRIACAALLILVVGDTVASLVGRAVGGMTLFGRKTVVGSLAMFVASVLLALAFVPPRVAVGGALAATLVELLPLPIDDNLTIPLAAGLALTLLSLVP